MGRTHGMNEETRNAIAAMLLEGKSQGKVAREFGTSQTTVYRIAKDKGIDCVDTQSKKATEALRALRDYDLAERVNLLNRMFDAAHALLDTPEDLNPSKLQQLTMAVAVLIDKRRLEEGEVTSRTESVSSAGARERVESQIDRLSRQLAQRKVALPGEIPASPDTADTDTAALPV